MTFLSVRSDVNNDTNNEPRLLDTDLAEALGMKEPWNIRKNLILPNMEELQRYGNLGAINPNPAKRGRPASVFHLNREQANLVSIFSRTEKAADVREVGTGLSQKRADELSYKFLF